MQFVETAKKFMLDPKKSFQKSRKDRVPYGYLVRISAIYAVLSGLIMGGIFAGASATLGQGSPLLGVGLTIAMILGIFVASIVGMIIAGLVLHVFAYLVGARKGLEQTLKTVIYGFTPTALLGWIPFVGVIFSIWTLVLEVVGLRELHKLTTGRAVIAVLLPIIIVGVIVMVFLAWLFTLIGPALWEGGDFGAFQAIPTDPLTG